MSVITRAADLFIAEQKLFNLYAQGDAITSGGCWAFGRGMPPTPYIGVAGQEEWMRPEGCRTCDRYRSDSLRARSLWLAACLVWCPSRSIGVVTRESGLIRWQLNHSQSESPRRAVLVHANRACRSTMVERIRRDSLRPPNTKRPPTDLVQLAAVMKYSLFLFRLLLFRLLLEELP